MDASKCSGTMTEAHTGADVRPVRIGIGHWGWTQPMCAPCRDAAARLGLLERRTIERVALPAEVWCRLCDQPTAETITLPTGETFALCNVHAMVRRWDGAAERLAAR